MTGTCTGCGSGGSSSWSGLTSPTSNLNMNLGTYVTGLSIGDFGATPSAGAFTVTDTATSSSDTSTNLLVGTGASSRHNSFAAQLNGVNQFQICWQPGPQGETVIGSAVPCAGINQSPFAKSVVISGTGTHTVQRLYQGSTSAAGTMMEWNNATVAGTGFSFWKACAGATGSDTGCGSGSIVSSLRGDGLFTAQSLKIAGITGSTQCLHVDTNGNVNGTGSDCGAGSGGGSGTVANASASQVAMYSANGTVVSGDSSLTDSGTLLSYSGAGGISASTFQGTGSGAFLETTVDQTTTPASLPPNQSTSYYSYDGQLCAVSPAGQVSCTEVDSALVHASGNETIGGNKTLTGALNGTSANFTGNLTVGGQIIGTGPWAAVGPVPGLSITPAASQSELAFDTNGFLVTSENGGSVEAVAKFSGATAPAGKTIVGTDANGHLVDASSVTLSNNTTGNAANLSGTPTLPNGTTATTQTAKDNSLKLATTAYADGEVPAATLAFIPFNDYNTINQGIFPTSGSSALIISFTLPYEITTSKVAYRVGSTADNTSNTYEIGIYASNGSLVLSYQSAGTSFAPTVNTIYRQSWSQGSTTLTPGKYYLVLSSSCTSSCATFNATGTNVAAYYYQAAASGVASSGVLNSSITAPGTGYESFSGQALSVIFE